MTHGWQASANYTLSALWDATAPWNTLQAILPGQENKALPTTAPDLGGEYALAATDQRHRATFNGVWQIGRGFQLSGLYFFGSGLRLPTSWGSDLRDTGIGSENRLRPDRTIVPRNNFVGNPIHRVDVRLQQSVVLAGRVKLDGIFDVFNLFDHANFGSYTTAENNPATYGQPVINPNLVYGPRSVQLGFRMSF